MLRRLLRSVRSGVRAADPVPLVLYTRPGCHLCDQMKARLEAERGGAYLLREVDVESDPELERRYGRSIPVIELAGRTLFKGRLDEARWRERFDRMAAEWRTAEAERVPEGLEPS